MIHKFPPEVAFFTESVAIASDIAPKRHKLIAPKSLIFCIRVFIIMRTPMKPKTKPKIAKGLSLSLNIIHPKKATINGIVLAIMAATDASILCTAMKFNPKYIEFWHIPKITVAFHWELVSFNDCPNSHPIPIANKPDTKNLSDKAESGGAELTIIFAEVNALDHINAKVIPNMSTRNIYRPFKIKEVAF